MGGQEMIGRLVGDYRITQVLGEGGMGMVFKGVHEQLGQVVAIKMLHPQLLADERIKSRFVREAQALARLNHQNVVRLLNFLNIEQDCFIVMEFIEGQTLEKLMSGQGVIDPIQAAEYFIQVLAAMHYAHGLGIVHRDIKPSNICLLNTGQIKVLDFGTAKMVGAQKLTQEGMTLGTLIYMSPEQVCGRDLDHRSDIYSLGVTLYEIVTAQLPHYNDDEMALVKEIVRGVPKPPSAHGPVPKGLETVIMRSIEKDPAKRYQTADEMLKGLSTFLAEAKGSSGAATPPREFAPAGANKAGMVPPKSVPAKPTSRGSVDGESGSKPNLGMLIAGIVTLVVGVGGSAIVLAIGGAFAIGLTGVLVSLVLGTILILLAVTKLGTSGSIAAAVPAVSSVPSEGSEDGTMRVDSGAIRAQIPDEPVPAPAAVAAGTPYLYVFQGADQGKSWPIPMGAVTIGRGPGNTVVLNDNGVSTTHAQVSFDGGHVKVTDLQSRNGTFVNNQRITEAELSETDVLVIGTTHMAISVQHAA